MIVADMYIQGPSGKKLHLAEGHRGSLAGFEELVYTRAYIEQAGHGPVRLNLGDGQFCDGTEASTRDPKIAGSASAPPDLWSLDGKYIAVQTVLKNRDGTFGFREPALRAFNTVTGSYVEFTGATAFLRLDTFRYWSNTDPNTAILQGRSGLEGAHPDE